MAHLPEDRDEGDSRADHIADHHEIARLHNLLDDGGGEGGVSLPVPSSGDVGKVVTVNVAEDGYELDAVGSDLPTPTSGDAGKVVTVNGAEDGYELDAAAGGGTVTSVNGNPGPGVTLVASDVGADAAGAAAAEAVLARNADNLTSGTVADVRIASTIARDSEVTSAVAAEAALARNADNLSSGTVADVRIAGTIARDSEVTSAVAAEATLARNADNLTSGTVADVRIASTIARDSEVTVAVAAEATLARNADNLTSGTVADARIASTIARDAEVTSAVSTHAGAADPHGDRAYADAKVTDAIADTVTTIAPSQNAVFDALALKAQGLTFTAVKTANYTAAANEAVPCDTAAGALTVTFPTAPANGTRLYVKKIGGGAALSLALGGSDVFNVAGGATTGSITLLNQGVVCEYKASGAIWYVVADDLPYGSLAKQVSDDQFINPLMRWHLAAADSMAGTGLAKVMFMGDSELAFVAAHAPAVQRLSVLLNPPDRTLVAGASMSSGNSYPGDSIFGVGAGVSVWSSTGTVNRAAQLQANRGMSGQALQLTNGQSVTCNGQQCDAVVFTWLAGAAASTLDLKIDGSVVTTVTASVAGTYTATGLNTAVTHTAGFASHGTTIVDSVRHLWGNSTYGVVPYAATATGSNVVQGLGWTDLMGFVNTINPDLIVIEWAINDFTSDGATWYTNMSTMIDNIRAQHADVSIVLWLPSEVLNHSPWVNMRMQARRLADTKGVALADAAETMPTMHPTDSYGIGVGDSIHYNTKGSILFSNALLSVLAGKWMRELGSVDANGTKAAHSSTWRSTGSVGGTNLPVIKVSDNAIGGGGNGVSWYTSEGDTYPVLSIGPFASAFQLVAQAWGAGGSSAPDIFDIRVRKNIKGILGGGGVKTYVLCLDQVGGDTASLAQTTEQDLYNNSSVVGAGLVQAVGDGVQAHFWGTTASNARTKRIRMSFQGTVFYDTGVMAYTGSSTDCWDLTVDFTRVTNTAMRIICKMFVNGTSTNVPCPTQLSMSGLSALDVNNSAMKVTCIVGSGAAASDVVLRGGKILFTPAAT